VRLAVLLIAAEICSMVAFASFAVTLPSLAELWHLSSAQAGLVGGAYYAGYVVAVPVLVGLTDRVDARPIYLASCALGVVAAIAFALLAHGMWSAALLRSLAGASLAGTYMPGLRLLTERLPAAQRIRAVPYYTASFGLGVTLSFLTAGLIEPAWGWRAVFASGAIGSVLAAALAFWAVAGRPPADVEVPPARGRHPLDFRPVLRAPAVRAYILAYAGHCWELFALRAWLVAYLLFAWERTAAGPPGQRITVWSAVITLAGVPASIAGAEIAARAGRDRMLRIYAVASVAVGIVAGALGGFSFTALAAVLFVSNVAIAADSGALTSAALAASDRDAQGATLAVHSLLGFLGGAIGPAAVGVVLQAAGGMRSARAWWIACAVMAAGSAIAAAAIWRRSSVPRP
jgi:predicted MFS family arabinose efflux permease